ncbi:MAG: ABC transporter permease [Desulfobacteraceae bacterium]|nr:MAG: ABC transporter permease [Desulfobacteraceae bacterium]
MGSATSTIGRFTRRPFGDFLLTATVVLLFTSLVLILSGAPPLAAYYHLLQGSLSSWAKFSQVVKVWIPLTLCACGLLFTFRIGLWNIGVEGQVLMGSVFATWALRAGVQSPDIGPVFIILSLAAAAAGGAMWAAVAGVLKTKGGVNEIFAGLGLNFVAQGIVLWLIFGPWKQPGVASMSGTETFPTALWLNAPALLRIPPVALALALAALLTTGLMLRTTRIGLDLKAAGSNPAAAFLYGLTPPRLMVLAMLFAGGFAGLAGNLQVTAVYHRLIPAISSNYGYLALLVVMLANYDIRRVAPVAFFFACLNVGSIQLPMMLKLDSSLSGVIQGALVLATLGIQGWRRINSSQARGPTAPGTGAA